MRDLSWALSYWRGRYTPTYLGLRAVARGLATPSALSGDAVVQGLVAKFAAGVLASPYAEFSEFKSVAEDGKATTRQCRAASPISAIIESVVLRELRDKAVVTNRSSVFSYRWPGNQQSLRPYEYYFKGYQDRQERIGLELSQAPDQVVVFEDVASCYPSIDQERLRMLLPSILSPTGRAAIENVFELGAGLPVGPALSHALAQLYLVAVDKQLELRYGDAYTRYVDDIAVVVRGTDAQAARRSIAESVTSVGLALNPSKSAVIDGSQWLATSGTLRDPKTVSRGLASLSDVLDAIRLLLWKMPDGYRHKLASALWEAGFSMPLDVLEAQCHQIAWREYIESSWWTGPWRLEFVALAVGRDGPLLDRIVHDGSKLRDRLGTNIRRELERLSGSNGSDEGQRHAYQPVRRMITQACFLSDRGEYARLAREIPEGAIELLDRRAILRMVAEARPGYILPYVGGPVRLASMMWRAQGLRASHDTVNPYSPEFTDSCVDLVYGGALLPSSVDLAHVPEDRHRIGEVMLRDSTTRQDPDFSYCDELESLTLGMSRTDLQSYQYVDLAGLEAVPTLSELAGY